VLAEFMEKILPVRTSATDVNAWALAALRIGVGALFLIFAEYKVFGTQFTLGGGFQGWINRFLADGAYPFMTPLLRNFVLPHGTAIAFLVAYGELAIGIALIVGVLVRPASICGGIFMLALLFSSDYPGPGAAFWQYFGASLSHSVFLLCFVAFVIGRADATLSIRPLLRRWRNNSLAPSGAQSRDE
jgi:thiosulfate dehydrogenase [quinone] large subunit